LPKFCQKLATILTADGAVQREGRQDGQDEELSGFLSRTAAFVWVGSSSARGRGGSVNIELKIASKNKTKIESKIKSNIE
jgi:hypothetical protein